MRSLNDPSDVNVGVGTKISEAQGKSESISEHNVISEDDSQKSPESLQMSVKAVLAASLESTNNI